MENALKNVFFSFRRVERSGLFFYSPRIFILRMYFIFSHDGSGIVFRRISNYSTRTPLPPPPLTYALRRTSTLIRVRHDDRFRVASPLNSLAPVWHFIGSGRISIQISPLFSLFSSSVERL